MWGQARCQNGGKARHALPVCVNMGCQARSVAADERTSIVVALEVFQLPTGPLNVEQVVLQPNLEQLTIAPACVTHSPLAVPAQKTWLRSAMAATFHVLIAP